MNILITGIAGFIGFSVGKKLLDKKHKVFGIPVQYAYIFKVSLIQTTPKYQMIVLSATLIITEMTSMLRVVTRTMLEKQENVNPLKNARDCAKRRMGA